MGINKIPANAANIPALPDQTGQDKNPGLHGVLDDLKAAKKKIHNINIIGKVDGGTSSGGIGGYDPQFWKEEIKQLVKDLIHKIKKAIKDGGTADFSMAISHILSKMTGFQAQQVGASTVIMGVGTARKAGLANINRLIAIKDNTPQLDVNPFTGKQEPGTHVSPEKALADQITFLVNNPMSKYELDKNGKSTGKLNPSYVFFHNANNYQSYVNQVTTFNAALSPIQTDGQTKHPEIPLPTGFPPANFADLKNFKLPPIDTTIPVNSTNSADKSWHLKSGSIAYINYLANPNGDQYYPSKTPGLVSDSFKKAYIAIYGQEAFAKLRIPPGLSDLNKFLQANPSNTDQLNAAVKRLTDEQARLATARADSDKYGNLAEGCRKNIASCTSDEYAHYQAEYTKAQNDMNSSTKNIPAYTSYVEQALMESSQGNEELDAFFKQIQNGTSPVTGTGAPKTPDSSALNSVTTALTELSGQNDTVTNTMSTFLKQETSNYQAAQTMLKNSLQDMQNIVKTQVQNLKTN